MKQDDAEPLIRNVLVALIITAIAIAAFLIPTPTADIPEVELKDIPPKAEARDVEVDNAKAPSLRSALVPVCSCEATGNPNNEPVVYHYEEDGVTPLIGRYNSADRGMCQINMDAHSGTIEEMGLDILSDFDDYITYTNHLYDTQGLKPWVYSKHCWQ